MKAIVFDRHGGPELLQLRDLPEPQPGANELLIAVRAVSAAPGDCDLRAGRLRRHFEIALPKTPGRYGAGTVIACGPQIAAFAPGDDVVFMCGYHEPGSYCERVVRPAERAVAMPRGLDHVAAVALSHAGLCAWVALIEVGRLTAGERILIHGASGAVGGLAVQLARHLGARITGTCRAANRDYVLGLGAERVIAYDTEDFPAGPRAFDMVLDLIGGRVHELSYHVLKPGGRLVYLNAAPFVDRASEFGVRLLNAPIRDDPKQLAAVFHLAEAGALTPQVAGTMPLAQAAQAHAMIEAGEVTRGRLVLTVPQ